MSDYGEFQILETEEEKERFKGLETCYEEIEITTIEALKLFKALQDGKSIGWNDGEYTHLITIKN